MLRFMRRHRQSILIKGILGLIVLVFVGWGVGTFDEAQRTAAVAVVDGIEITAAQLEEAQQNLRRFYQELYRDAYSPDLVRELDLDGRALDDLITAALLTREAERLGLRVTDEEVADAIMGMPLFRPNGRFDRDTYVRYLRFARLTDADFVEQQRRGLLVRKMEALVTDGARMSDEEVRDRYVLEKEQIDVRFVRVPWQAMRDAVSVTDADLAAYLDQNRSRYEEPERVSFRYVAYRPADFTDGVEISDDEIATFYERHRVDRFTDPPAVRARQIVLAVPKGASDETRAAIKKRAAELAARAATEPFAALAQRHSADKATAATGGDLGWVARTQLPRPVAEAAFALAKDGVSEPIEMSNEIFVLKVEDTRDERTRPLDEVRDDIVDALRTQKARERARETAGADSERTVHGATLEQVAEAGGRTVRQSPPLAPRDRDPELGYVTPLVTAALALEPNLVSDVVEAGDAYFLVTPAEKQPAYVPELAAVRARVEDDLRRERAIVAARERAEALLARLRETKDVVALARAEQLTVEETGPFDRTAPYIPKAGSIPELQEELFTLSPAAPIASKVYANAGGEAIVAVLKERIAPDLADLDTKRDMLRDGYLQRKKQALIAAYVTGLKQQARIDVRQDRLPPT